MKFSAFTLVLCLLLSCKESTKMKIEIISHQELTGIPSASGMVKLGEEYFVTGDDSPYLFSLDKEMNLKAQYPIYSLKKLDGDKFIKAEKPDFEAMEMLNDSQILVFGSGSKSPQRDVFLRITLNGKLKVEQFNISELYNNLKEMDIMDGAELNIEALAFNEGNLYLFNRGRNIIFTFDYTQLMSFLEKDTDFFEPKAKLYELPEINGIQSGFSGATIFNEKLIFTSSVEDTDNAYDDGEILGSFIGLIDIFEEKELQYVLIPNKVHPLKVETVTIDKVVSDKELIVMLATDSDGGVSELLKARIYW